MTSSSSMRPRGGVGGARSANRSPRTDRWASLRRRLDTLESPVTSYVALQIVVGLLVLLGLVMVLSASMIVSLKENDSSFSIFLKQLSFAGIGTIALWIASRRTIGFWKRLALPILGAAIVGQLLVFTPLGIGFQGNRNWLDFGVVTVQPSEFGKLALVLFGALVLANKAHLMGNIWQALIPFVLPVAAIIIGLVLLGHDLGTALVLCAIVAVMLFVAGVALRWFVVGFVGFGLLVTAATLSSANRMGRIAIWLDPSTCDPYGLCRQPLHGRYALADGGWFGVGLGASREKWQWLPEPHNDFIFAIIGEELGLPGTLFVLGLFLALAWVALRMVRRTDDQFVRLVTAGILGWIVVQALINIGAVIGALPVIGVPLPFVSSGGSSLVTTMLAAGVLLSFARQEPGCAEMLRERPNWLRSSLSVLPTIRRTSRR